VKLNIKLASKQRNAQNPCLLACSAAAATRASALWMSKSCSTTSHAIRSGTDQTLARTSSSECNPTTTKGKKMIK
jgi:hypothetical protein